MALIPYHKCFLVQSFSPKLEIVLGESMNISETKKHVMNVKLFHAPKNTQKKHLKHKFEVFKGVSKQNSPAVISKNPHPFFKVPPTGYVFSYQTNLPPTADGVSCLELGC